jgi:hypothetical protein
MVFDVVFLNVGDVVIHVLSQSHGPVHVTAGGHEQGLQKDGAAVSGGGVVGKDRPAGTGPGGKIVPFPAFHLSRWADCGATKGAQGRQSAVTDELWHTTHLKKNKFSQPGPM